MTEPTPAPERAAQLDDDDRRCRLGQFAIDVRDGNLTVFTTDTTDVFPHTCTPLSAVGCEGCAVAKIVDDNE